MSNAISYRNVTYYYTNTTVNSSFLDQSRITQAFKYTVVFCCTHHPQTNGLDESTNKSIQQ